MKCILPLCFIIMCWIYTDFAESIQLTNRWTRYTYLDGFIATQGTVVVAKSRAQCGRLCICTNTCQTFFYIVGEVEQNCHLHDAVHFTSLGMASSPNAIYYIPDDVLVPSPPPFPNDELYHSTILSDGSLFTFKFHNQNLAYAFAAGTCLQENGRLVRITTSAKFEMLRTVLGHPGYTSSATVYVDGMYNIFDGLWHFNNGDIAAFPVPFWAPNEPQNILSNSYHCTRLRDNKSWYAENWGCFDMRPFICER